MPHIATPNNTRPPVITPRCAGADPTEQIETRAKQAKAKLSILSMGQGQEVAARRLVSTAALEGRWVLLQNTHLNTQYLAEVWRGWWGEGVGRGPSVGSMAQACGLDGMPCSHSPTFKNLGRVGCEACDRPLQRILLHMGMRRSHLPPQHTLSPYSWPTHPPLPLVPSWSGSLRPIEPTSTPTSGCG